MMTNTDRCVFDAVIRLRKEAQQITDWENWGDSNGLPNCMVCGATRYTSGYRSRSTSKWLCDGCFATIGQEAKKAEGPQWEIKIHNVRLANEYGGEAVTIYAMKEGEPCRTLVWEVNATAGDAEIEQAAREALAGVDRLNARLTSTKPGIREKLLDVIETIRREQ